MQIRLIIAGGRTYRFKMDDLALLHSVRMTHEIIEVVGGRAPGADAEGEDWAKMHGIPFRPFPAAWTDLSHPDAIIKVRHDGTKYDARAGFRRNQQMAEYANACALFPGDNGTNDMATRAYAQQKVREFVIFDWRYTR